MEEIKILPAQREHAGNIAQAILLAIGDELVDHLAGCDHNAADVRDLFRSLAERTDSQYSYKNSFIAVNEDGTVLGVVICYDGALLHYLRNAFFEAAKDKIGLVIDGTPDDETGPEEVYLDSLAVFPEYRGKGIAKKLINEVGEKARQLGKPLGLLCSSHNSNARKLYDSMGFKYIGKRPFAGEMMDHLMKKVE